MMDIMNMMEMENMIGMLDMMDLMDICSGLDGQKAWWGHGNQSGGMTAIDHFDLVLWTDGA